MDLRNALANPPQLWTPDTIGLTVVWLLLLSAVGAAMVLLPRTKRPTDDAIAGLMVVGIVTPLLAGAWVNATAWRDHVGAAVAQHVQDEWDLVALEKVAAVQDVDQAWFDAVTPDGATVFVVVTWADHHRTTALPGTYDPITVTVDGHTLEPGDDVDQVLAAVRTSPEPSRHPA